MNDAAFPAIPPCRCGAPAMAVAPGQDPETVADLFAISRGVAMRVWCLRCWPFVASAEPHSGAGSC